MWATVICNKRLLTYLIRTAVVDMTQQHIDI